LAWCYGDAAIGFALMKAGGSLGREDWREIGVQVAVATTGQDMAATGVVDASLCHGSGGLLQLYTRLHQATGLAVFRDESRRWWQHAMRLSRKPGLAAFSYPKAERRTPDVSLLTGAGGTALALLAAADPTNLDWDQFLLLS
jgi:hypothetical protein